ncbi:MAG: hypothetical protein K8R90_03625 [Candidatus Cloacimonetes bacterium]|nr:hypothetical protein [Candidatus Cloacimonadota bacterium]
MKTLRCIVILSVAVLVASCTGGFSTDGVTETAYVDAFMNDMRDNFDDNELLLGYVSPEAMAKLGVDMKVARCNSYSPDRWEVASYDHKSGDLGVMLYGSQDAWQHLLTFRLIKEDGRLYFVPAQYDWDYVDPWFTVQINVGQEEKALVDEFLQKMIDDYYNEPLLLSYISPAYCRQKGIDKDDYSCNAYGLESFVVGKIDPATREVEAIILGEDEDWAHKLTFKIVDENGRMYLWPGSNSDSYIDPWFKLETGVQ